MRSSLLSLFLGVAPAVLAVQPAPVQRFHAERVLGTTFDMVTVGLSLGDALRAQGAALGEIARLDRVLSGWREDSELAVLNRSNGAFAASHDLFEVIAACEAWRESTGGRFNARLGKVEAVWDAGERAGLAPAAAALAPVLTGAHEPARLDAAARTIDRGGAVFAIDALAKGYIVDAALRAAKAAAPQAAGFLVNIGGDLACHGMGPGGEPWRVGIAAGGEGVNQASERYIRLSSGGVATSGLGERDRVIGDVAHGRTLDPASGAPATARLATVTAPTTAEADALATAFSVMPPQQAIAFADARPGVAARIVDAQGLVHPSARWRDESAPVRLQSVAETLPALPSGKPWPQDFRVAIGYTIFGGVEHPPMMVIYVTDARGALIRTVGSVGKAPVRFLDSNYVWHGAWKKKVPATTVEDKTHPTRPPGHYTMMWDGKDDYGRPVPQGRYTINIEASREQGGHGVQKIVLDLGALPTSGLAPPAEEAGPASARYGVTQGG